MARQRRSRSKSYGARCRPVSLSRQFNWPAANVRGKWWRKLAGKVGKFPAGNQTSWGIPFKMAGGARRVILLTADSKPVTVKLTGKADYLCILHEYAQPPEQVSMTDPAEGLVVGEYVLEYTDGTTRAAGVRARFEVAMAESPGPPWLAVPFTMPESLDPADPPPGFDWARAQTGVKGGPTLPRLWAMPNPKPAERLKSVTFRGLTDAPLLVAALTLYQGRAHPLQHLPRRTYRVRKGRKAAKVASAEVDLGVVTRLEETTGPRGAGWLKSPYAGLFGAKDPADVPEKLIEAVGAADATVSVKLAGRRKPVDFSLGETFAKGRSSPKAGGVRLEVLGKTRQWMKVTVTDSSTGKPAPVRIHFSGPAGEYIAPYGHHAQINAGWFMDYGADVVAGGRNYAYVDGEFTTDLPVGDLYVEMVRGFEYAPVRKKVTVRPGQKELKLTIRRAMDWRSAGWVTADTHVHFISPDTAWLQAQGEGVNVVNLLASQWGRLFTNVGDIRGRVNILENDTIVYVGTENRNHMLGHMSMLGTQGLPVYPMCAGGVGEAWIGDPDFVAMAEWALENRRKGGVVIRPHYPYCGHTEDPVPILQGLVDALEIRGLRGSDFSTQEWYRYLNCGYRVAVCGGTDKMGAYTALGNLRTYALLDKRRPFDYANWARAVRAGRCFATTGPLIDIAVDGKRMGESIRMPTAGGTVEVQASAESVWPMGMLEIVHNGNVVARRDSAAGAKRLRLSANVPVTASGWIAARCSGADRHPGGYVAAHTSPVYLQVGRSRAFDGPAAEHMLALVEGGIEYLRTISTAFDESSRKRMVKLFQEAQAELKGRLVVEAAHTHHHGHAPYHHHGHGGQADHKHQ